MTAVATSAVTWIMIERPRPPSEMPRTEPEIIPPNPAERGVWPPQPDFSVRGTQRVYVTKVGPFGLILIGIVIAAVAALLLLLVVGAFLLWIPVVALLLAIGIFSGLLRRR